MISLSAKTHYGIIALIELSDNFGKNLVQINDIVRKHTIPQNYLEQILNRMQKAGLVRSVRGNKGGYELQIHPDDLSLLKIIETLEGPLELSKSGVFTAMDEILRSVENAVKAILNQPLSQLSERQKALEQQFIYSI